MANKYVKFHGIKLADGSEIENLRVEKVTADPTPISAGRLWYNETTKAFKFSSLDGSGNIIIRQAASLEELNTEVATLNTAITNEASTRASNDSTLQTNIDTEAVNRANHPATIIFNTTNNSASNFIIDGDSNPTLKLTPGVTYRFDLNLGTHPIVITSAQVTSNFSSNYYNDGLSHVADNGTTSTGAAAQGKTSGKLFFKVPHDAPDQVYYICTNHPAAMAGILKTSALPATVQQEIDAIELGAGLETNGTYNADSTTVYLTTASSLKDADNKLDTAINNVSLELDTTQNSAGFTGSGAYLADGSSNYISSATTLKNADTLLDAQIKTNADAIAAEISARTNADNAITTDITNLQSDVTANTSQINTVEASAGLNVSGLYVAEGSSNYITAATSLKDADNKLDTQIKTNADAILTKLPLAGGTMSGDIDGNGNKVLFANVYSALSDLPSASTYHGMFAHVHATGKGYFAHAGNWVELANYSDLNDYLSLSGGTMTSAINMGGQKITNLGTPTVSTDASTKAYVDSVANGLDVKNSVRVATTTNGTLSSAFANGQTIDGVTLSTGDRILLKNQTTGSENGIYTVNSSGAPTRAEDFDTDTEVTAGAFTFIEEGTINGNNGFVVISDDPVTVGTTSITFQQFSGAGQILEGNGLQKDGNTLSVKLDGTSISASSSGIKLSDTLSNKITTNETNISNLQTELDATQTGAGLGSDGSYTANNSSNYITGATTLQGADNLLDTQVKSVVDLIDTIESSVGLSTTGTYSVSGTNYINSSTSITSAIGLLDTQIKTNYDDLESLILDVESNSEAESSARIAGDNSVRTSVNNLRFTYQSSASALVHTIAHNLNSNFLLFQVMVLDSDGKYKNDVVPVEETDANTLTITLTQASHIRVSVMSMTNI